MVVKLSGFFTIFTDVVRSRGTGGSDHALTIPLPVESFENNCVKTFSESTHKQLGTGAWYGDTRPYQSLFRRFDSVSSSFLLQIFSKPVISSVSSANFSTRQLLLATPKTKTKIETFILT